MGMTMGGDGVTYLTFGVTEHVTYAANDCVKVSDLRIIGEGLK